MIGNIEANGSAKTEKTTPRVNTPRNTGSRSEYLPGETEETGEPELASLKDRFKAALLARALADKSLFSLVAELIAAGIERDEAIDWGIETGLSESYVRSTVSRLYSDVDGGKNAKGQGRKTKAEAVVIYEHCCRLYGVDKAQAICLAASRYAEKVNKAKAKASK